MNQQEIQEIVMKVLEKIDNPSQKTTVSNQCTNSEDITKVDISKQLFVNNPKNKESYLKMKSYTPARLGVGRAGTRYKTSSMLRFKADHAAAMDAVFSMVEQQTIDEIGNFGHKVLHVKTKCETKDQYLTRPDLGKEFEKEELESIKNFVSTNKNVQIVVGDGLSSAAIKANITNILPAILQSLKNNNLTVSDIVFVELCRVGAMDVISELANADVTLMLIGERPGLATANSMSAYMAYKATVGMPEARRTVVSNIHDNGTSAIEAGAHIGSIIKKMIDTKTSGVDLKL